MFEGLQDIVAAWRTIVHISEWSGLSIGALAAGAALFVYVPVMRRLVIRGAVLVLVGWVCLIHGDRVGRADVEAQWKDARAAAIAAEQERDTMVEQQLEGKYAPQLDALKKRAADNKVRADGYERKIIAMLANAGSAAHACELGDAADWVRGGRQARDVPEGRRAPRR